MQKISKSPNCIVLKSLTMQKGHGTIGREAAFRVIPIWGVPSELHSDRQTHFSGQAAFRVIPIWGVPSELHSDRRTHFSGQVVKEICKIWPIMQHFHCVYQPGSSRLVNRTNGTIKTQLAKIMNFLFLTFASGPSIGSPQPQIHSFGKHHLSPFVIITGRPMRLDEGLYDPTLLKGDKLLQGFNQLIGKSF